MNSNKDSSRRSRLLDAVALLQDTPKLGLKRGQVGTIVEKLDSSHVLVEFSDDEGRAFAIEPFDSSQLLILRYAPEAA